MTTTTKLIDLRLVLTRDGRVRAELEGQRYGEAASAAALLRLLAAQVEGHGVGAGEMAALGQIAAQVAS